MPKIAIMQEGMNKRAYIDGEEMSGLMTAVDARTRPDEIPTVDFETTLADGFLELCNSDVRIKAHPGTLQEAACIIRDELLKRGDLYSGFVANILGVFMPREHHAGDGEFGIYAEYGVKYLAGEISNRTTGLEDK